MRLFQNTIIPAILLLAPFVPLFAADQTPLAGSDPAEINALVDALSDFVRQNSSIFNPHRLNEDEIHLLKTAIEQGTRLFETTPSVEQKYWAAEFLVKARLTLARVQPPSSMAELRTLEELVSTLEKKPEKVEILPTAKDIILKYSILLLTKQGDDLPDPYQVKEAVKLYIAENPKALDTFGKVLVDVAVQYVSRDRQFTIDTLKDIAELCIKSPYLDDRTYAVKLLNKSKRFEMIGNSITFSGVDLAGNKIGSIDYKNKVVLIDFWETSCAPCIVAIPEMKRLYETYNKQGFEIVGVNGDSKEKLERFLEERKLPWKNISDTATADKGGVQLARFFGVSAYPTLMLVGRNGKLIATDFDLKTLEKELVKQFNNNPSNSSKPRQDAVFIERTNPITPSLL